MLDLHVELSALVGDDVQVLRRQLPDGRSCWLCAPTDCRQLTSPLRQAFRASPGAGLSPSPEAANVQFAADVHVAAEARGCSWPRLKLAMEEKFRA
jgi:hypothetical protein